MRRTILVVAAYCCALTVPAAADVTLKQTTGGKGLGISGNASGVTYIKGNKMRSDSVVGGRTQTTIFDIDAQKLYVFDSKKKEADVWDMAAFGAEIANAVDLTGAKATLAENGKTKQIGTYSAVGYDVEVSMQSAFAGSKDLNLTVTLSGPVWIVKDSPGAADFSHFYQAAVEKGWIFADPRGAKAQPGQAKAVAEMYGRMAEIGGIPYETAVQVKLSGGGPAGAILANMGGLTMTTLVDSVEVAPLADDLFMPPAGYKLNERH